MHFNRSAEILHNYLAVLDQHLKDILDGRADKMFELQEIAALLFIHPTHLSNVIKEYTGHHPCYFYEEKILVVAKDLLKDPHNSIADVARKLTYDPSNFTKWFKVYGGVSPSAYRKQLEQQLTVA
ncbi:MAG TPA: AraC family transcriptional regulator [Puia sp.]